ncbi:MAG: glycosidase, partial [Phycisphaerae bacterium]|nr:glycosidase [Phycisphaerae bacterium]
WTAYSPDLFSWGRHEMTLAPAPGTWQAGRVGCGAPPIRTDEGWLEIYHAADTEGRYAMGAMLSDPDYPEKIISHSSDPVFQPEADYERSGLYDNVVFSSGLLVDDDGVMTIYYGAADRVCAAAVTSVDEMIAAAKS